MTEPLSHGKVAWSNLLEKINQTGELSEALREEELDMTVAQDFDHYNAQFDRVEWLRSVAPGRMSFWEDSAASGDMRAQFLCAKVLQTGAAGETDLRRALFFYEKAAEQGLGAAMVNAGRLLMQGAGCEKNVDGAMAYYQSAADMGYSSGLYNIGLLLTEGKEVAQDLPRALEIWTQLEREGAKGAAEYRKQVWSQLIQEG